MTKEEKMWENFWSGSHKEIITCKECKGEGLTHCEELTDYHNGHYDRWTKKCSYCNGSGRVLEETMYRTTAYKQKKVEKK